MRSLPLGCIAVAFAIALWSFPREHALAPDSAPTSGTPLVEETGAVGMPENLAQQSAQDASDGPDQIVLKPQTSAWLDVEPPQKPDLSLLVYYAYSEVPPDEKPADTILNSMKDIPEGTPIEEITRVSAALGLDATFMKAVAKIESGFDPKQRTGSYVGLYQLSDYEFAKYGSGDILNARHNAIAGAYKIVTEGALFEMDARKKPTTYDLYLIHQQGLGGAEEHVSHPERVAWESMCATEEGRKKCEKWCKRAIWANTLPEIKKIWKTVDNLTSSAFVSMWHDRLDMFYSRYAEAQ
jgi:hypothetical protein